MSWCVYKNLVFNPIKGVAYKVARKGNKAVLVKTKNIEFDPSELVEVKSFKLAIKLALLAYNNASIINNQKEKMQKNERNLTKNRTEIELDYDAYYDESQ